MASSCQKEIQISLNSASPQIVIEASLSDLPNGNYVKLSQTVNYYNSDSFPPVNGAIVKITDNLGDTAKLPEVDSIHGIYAANFISGIPGRTYTLTVLSKGITYTSVSTMPNPVKIDYLNDTIIKSGGFGGGGGGGASQNPTDTTYRIVLDFQDPAGISNYYRFVEIIDGITYNSASVTSDRFRDGKVIERTMRIDTSLTLVRGNVVTMELQSIDVGAYNFFRTFGQAAGRGGLSFLSASPGNPISNISNGAMGYFSAYSTDRESIIIH